jgi:hypothetical protein
MSYLAGTITEASKIVVLDSNGANLVTKTLYPEDTYTKLLLHGDESPLVDSSPRNQTLTMNGNIARTAPETQAMFGGYCIYFDGSDDYISIPDSEDWNFGSGSFTVDFWFNFSSFPTSGNYKAFYNQRVGTGTSADEIGIYLYNNGGTYQWRLQVDYNAVNRVMLVQTAPGLVVGEWHHIAFVKDGNNYYVFQDGIKLGTTYTNSYTLPNIADVLHIGNNKYTGGTGQKINGYMDELRISKGIARWTSNFTPPISAYKSSGPQPYTQTLNDIDRYGYYINDLTVLSGTVLSVHPTTGETTGYIKTNFVSDVSTDYTKLLLHFNESPLVDATGKTLTLNGSIARSSTQSKFGGYSGYFNGTSQYITTPDSEDWNFGSGDFTIDLWAYFINFTYAYGLVSHSASDTTVNSYWSFFYSQNNGLHFSVKESGTFRVDIEQGSPTLGWATHTWYHLAVVRHENVFTIYRNGISLGSQTWSGTMVPYSVPLNIGIARKTDGLITQEFYGYIDELRISKGIVRWKHNFTHPTLAYTV